MRLAAKRLFLLAVLALAGVSASAAIAGPLDPIGTVTSAVSTIAGQTTIVSGLTGGGGGGGGGGGSGSGSSGSGGGSGSGAANPVSGVVGTVTGTAGGLLSGGSSGGSGGGGSGGGGAGGGIGAVLGGGGTGGALGGSPGGSAGGSAGRAVDGLTGVQTGGGNSARGRAARTRASRTRFDSLPRRYENLLKRVELGHNVRANIARLRSLLASASPQFRARILHLIRQEIRRLRKGGLTRRERLAVRRLHRLLTALHRQGAPAPTQQPTSAALSQRPGMGARVAGGVLGAGHSENGGASHANNTPQASAPQPGGHDSGGLPFVPPTPSSTALYWLALALLGTVFLALLLLALASQRPLAIPMPGAVAARAPQLKALGLMMAFVGGLGIYLLVLLA